MLSSHPWASLLLLCAVAAALSNGALQEEHNAIDGQATRQIASMKSKPGEDLAVINGNVNESRVGAISARPEEGMGFLNRTGDSGVSSSESAVVESEPVSQGGIDQASQGEESSASDKKVAQTLDGEAGLAPQGEISSVSSGGEISDKLEGEHPPAQDEANSGSPAADGSDGEMSGKETASGTEQQPESADTPAKESYGFSSNEDERTGKILAYYTTKTKNLFATTTISRLSTCFSATNSGQCQGRRKKRNLDRSVASAIFDLESSEDLPGAVEGTVDPSFESGNQVRGDRDPKKFTVWSTLFSTFTLTSTYYYPGTTVTVSGLCVLPGFGSGCFG